MRYFERQPLPFHIFEENDLVADTAPPGVTVWRKMTPAQLEQYTTIYLSPGVNPHLPLYATVQHKLSNDLNLFTPAVKKPYIVITGSNGKTTLVHLLEAALRGAGLKALAVGNNGVPMLDHLDDVVDYFVLELSSYQLELAQPFLCEVAYISNISPDHLDRHGTLSHYAALKARVYTSCRAAVVNTADPWCQGMTITAPTILPVQTRNRPLPLKMIGPHNEHHARAVMTILQVLGVDPVRAQAAVESFPGLAHRCELVLEQHGVTWWNDSKGTNIEATLAAVHSLNQRISGKIVLLLGGQDKGQDFTPFIHAVCQKTRAVIVFGACKLTLAQVFLKNAEALHPALVVVATLAAAVSSAKKYAKLGDAVLFSPACASFDMFQNYADRGQQFKSLLLESPVI